MPSTDAAMPDSAFRAALALHRAGDQQGAAEAYRRLLQDDPGHAGSLHMLGHIEFQLGNTDEAIALVERSLRSDPGNARAHSDLGVMRRKNGEALLALASFRDAAQLDPGNARAWNNLGNCLLEMLEPEQALGCHENALRLKPDYAEAWYNRGNSLYELARDEEAIGSFRRALALKQDYPEALNNLARTINRQGRGEEALALCDQALRLRPDFIDAASNRAHFLGQLERYAEAAEAYELLLRLQPGNLLARSGLLHLRLKTCDWRGYHAQVAEIEASVAAGFEADSAFGFLSICDSPGLQLACARAGDRNRHDAARLAAWRRSASDRRHDDGRLRIAYLSSDYREHPLAQLVAELFELHDRRRFEIIGLGFGKAPDSPPRRRILSSFDRYIEAEALDDAAAARQLEALGVDIAIDLNGHTAHQRDGILALRPAPIQVNYMGYPGSMGVDRIDYILADRHLILPDEEQHYSEAVVRLPDSYQVNDRKRPIADAVPDRVAMGLPQRGFVFCCFNNCYKISPDLFEIWMRLLRQVEGSVLWLHRSNGHMPGNLAREAEAHGVDPRRLVYKPQLRLDIHLGVHRHADLFLDTLPYNAHTTASDALWAGVPVLTCRGGSFAGRVASSLLHAVGLPELVTESLPDYEALALRLARHPEELAALRAKLARQRDTWPLFDTPRFTRHIETAYETMWRRHAQRLPTAGFDVPAAGH